MTKTTYPRCHRDDGDRLRPYHEVQRLAVNCLIMCGVAVVLSVPFLVTGNFVAYVRALGLRPDRRRVYQDPLCFSFSGLGALYPGSMIFSVGILPNLSRQ